jgi:hypothetical protein
LQVVPGVERLLALGVVARGQPGLDHPAHGFIAHAVMIPSGVPPTQSSRSMPVLSEAAAMPAATSPSENSLIRAPAARTSAISC